MEFFFLLPCSKKKQKRHITGKAVVNSHVILNLISGLINLVAKRSWEKNILSKHTTRLFWVLRYCFYLAKVLLKKNPELIFYSITRKNLLDNRKGKRERGRERLRLLLFFRCQYGLTLIKQGWLDGVGSKSSPKSLFQIAFLRAITKRSVNSAANWYGLLAKSSSPWCGC